MNVNRIAPIIRDFLATGSNLHIRTDGSLRSSDGMPREWAMNGPRAAWIEAAIRRCLAALDDSVAAARIERIVRRLGQKLPSGIIVLAAVREGVSG